MKIFAWLGAGFVAYMFVLTIALSSAMSGGAGTQRGSFPADAELDLDAEQVRNATISLTVSDELRAPALSVLAMIVGALGESDLKVVSNGAGSGYCGVYQAHPDNIDCDDTELQARSFLKGGLGFQAGGAIQLAKGHPDMSPGTIATKVEASGQPGSFYDDGPTGAPNAQRRRAERIIAAWRSGGSLDTNPAGGRDFIAEADRMISLDQPYTWGGGHLDFDPDGPWDCSGAVSWLAHYLGLLDGRPLTSGEFEHEGAAGRGQVFTIYANTEHVFIVVEAGVHRGDAWGTATRDLEGAQGSGPLWHHHSTSGFVARHYKGW